MEIAQYILIGVIVVMFIGYFILSSRKTKAENQKIDERTNSLKRGDEIITTAGVYGKIIDIKKDGDIKKVIIETGDNDHKGYLTIDAYSIYSILNADKTPADVKAKEGKLETKAEEVKVEEVKSEEIKVEEPKSEEKPAKKKKSK